MVTKIQPSFAKGEISPALFGRVDTAMYQIGLAKALNMIIHTYGGASNRHGTKYIGPVKDHDNPPRLVEFQFKTTDSYILEFGNQYMRVIRDDGHVVDSAATVNIEGATQADPVVITSTAHNLTDGTEVFISGVSGMIELNTNRYIVANAAANTFELTSQVDGTDIDGTGFGAYTSGGMAEPIFEIATPYLQADLLELDFTQSADVMTIAHKDYPIKELSRFDHDNWVLSDLVLGPLVASPTNGSVTANTTGSEARWYKVTAISEDGEESLAQISANSRNITNITQADPAVVTMDGGGYSIAQHDGGEFYFENIVGMTELNGQRHRLNFLTATTAELIGVDSTGFSAYTSGGGIAPTHENLANSNVTEDNTISWDAVADAEVYAVYRSDTDAASGYGLIGETPSLSFTDTNFAPNTSATPPKAKDPFQGDNDQPGAVGFYEQRRVFGGSIDDPDTIWFSQTGNFSNFNVSRPVQDDDAITVTLSSQQVNEIRHFVSLNDLIVFTSGSEWRVNAGPDQNFSTDTVRLRPQTRWGSSYNQPLVVGNSVIWITDNEADVRSLGYSLEIDGYTGANLNILSQHLTRGYRLVNWCQMTHPESRIFLIRNDGKALTLSFDQEQEVIAWTPWETDGWFERCESLRGGGPNQEDSVYFVVKRKINGNDVRYIEVYRQFAIDKDVRDCYYVDAGASFDNPITITDVTSADPVVVTAPSHGLTDGDEVDIFDIVWEANVDEFGTSTQPSQLNTKRFLVNNATTHTFELQDLDGVDIDGSAFNAYVSGGTVRLTVTTVLGLNFLEGEMIKILADGNVISNLTVENGRVTLPRKFSRIHVGLGHNADMVLLEPEAPSGTIQGYLKKISKVVIRFFRSRGLLIGPDEDSLVEMKQREFELMGDPTDLLTGDKEIYIDSQWNSKGRVFMRQKDPLPMTILAAIPTIDVGAQE